MPAPDQSAAPAGHARNWDALAAVIASLVGALALAVSAYTAYLQRTQVRAQVWPYLLTADYDTESAVKLLNKGVGPAIVRSMRVWVDRKPQANWRAVVTALGIERSALRTSTVSDNVVSGGEIVPMLVFSDNDAYRRFRGEGAQRVGIEICYCSTLDECWLYGGSDPQAKVLQAAVDRCPVPDAAEAFSD